MIEEQIVDVRLGHLARKARVDRSVLSSVDPQLFGGLVAEDHVGLRDAERLEVGAKERPGRVEVEHSRDADSNPAPRLPRLRRRPPEGALDGDAAQAEEAAPNLDVVDRRALFGHRRVSSTCMNARLAS